MQSFREGGEVYFDALCLRAFELLERSLIETPILIALDWAVPFEIMCDASDVAMDVVLDTERIEFFTLFIMQERP